MRNKDTILLEEAYKKVQSKILKEYSGLSEPSGMQGPYEDEADVEHEDVMEEFQTEVKLNGKEYYSDSTVNYTNNGYHLYTNSEKVKFSLYDENGTMIFDENIPSEQNKLQLTPEEIKEVKNQIVKDFESRYRHQGKKYLPDYEDPRIP